MKKTERINTIMRYINNRAHFTISEIMKEFNISRSTAIRDIREIESMGMPLVSEVGRGGGYSVLHNSFLPEVRFTDQEVKALFIAFMATRNQQLPYLKSRQTLAEKLLGLIPESQQDDLILLNELLLFEGTNPHRPDLLELSDIPHPMLDKLIQVLLTNRFLQITVQEENQTNTYSIYLLHLHHQKGVWFLEGFCLQDEKTKFFSIDQLIDVESDETSHRLSEEEIFEKRSKQRKASNLIVELGPKAIAQFKKYHPFRFSISYTNPYQTTATFEMFVHVDQSEEVAELVNWLLFLGKDIHIRKMPKEVKKELRERFKICE